jgi:hypothetical protein
MVTIAKPGLPDAVGDVQLRRLHKEVGRISTTVGCGLHVDIQTDGARWVNLLPLWLRRWTRSSTEGGIVLLSSL